MTAIGFILLAISLMLGTSLEKIPVSMRTIAWRASDYSGYAGWTLCAAGITLKLWESMP